MGKQPKTGVYQLNCFREMDAIKELRDELTHINRQEIFYGEKWTPEKKEEAEKRIKEIKELITLLGG
jgi:hypothetical protein